MTTMTCNMDKLVPGQIVWFRGQADSYHKRCIFTVSGETFLDCGPDLFMGVVEHEFSWCPNMYAIAYANKDPVGLPFSREHLIPV